MTLARRIADLARTIGREIRKRVTIDHPGLARAWVCFGVEGSTVVIRAAYNVAHVSRVAKGKYRVEFEEPMPDTDYCWFALARNSGSLASVKQASARATAEAKTRCAVEVICTTQGGTLSDTSELNLTVFR